MQARQTWLRCGLLVAVFLLLADAARAEDYSYTINYGSVTTITITAYTGSGGAVTIPSTINGLPVTTIGYQAFNGNTNITSLIIPDSITSLESALYEGGPFASCVNLISVTLPKGINNIGVAMFYGCYSLTSITMGTNPGFPRCAPQSHVLDVHLHRINKGSERC